MFSKKYLLNLEAIILLGALFFVGCQSSSSQKTHQGKFFSKKVGLSPDLVIAHRGASYYAPEETAAAYLLARDLGADFLELDLQRSKDGILIAFHDDNLKRTTNVQELFPDRVDRPLSYFTLAELKRLDAGSWFNKKFPSRARSGFKNLKILTLDEVLDIAEGSGKIPGVYIETKVPANFPGIEKDLKKLLVRRGWYKKNGGGKGQVILQTFSKDSLQKLNKFFPYTPLVFLLWYGGPKSGYMESFSKKEYRDWLQFAEENGAVAVGPNYKNLLEPWMVDLIHDHRFFIHPYTVDELPDFKKLYNLGIGGFFTNRPFRYLSFLNRAKESEEKVIPRILKKYGF